MRLLVTGNTGQLAKSLKERAGFFGAEISQSSFNNKDIAHKNAAAFSSAPQSKEDYLQEIKHYRPDIIVNCATIAWREFAENSGDEYFSAQILEAQNIASAAKESDLPLIHISCHHVFDGKSDYPYTEKSPPSGTSEIGRAVIQAEDAVINNTNNHVILRTSWLYGESGDNILTRLISMLKTAKAGMNINIPKAFFGSPTSTDDIADGIFEICNNLISSPNSTELRGIFNIANHGTVSAAAFAKFLASFFDVPLDKIQEIELNNSENPEHDFIGEISENAVYDCSKLLYTHGIMLGDWRQALLKVLRKMQLKENNNDQ